MQTQNNYLFFYLRPDRDDHVEIIEENIEQGKEHNFKKKPAGPGVDEVVVIEASYDLFSLLHYPGKANFLSCYIHRNTNTNTDTNSNNNTDTKSNNIYLYQNTSTDKLPISMRKLGMLWNHDVIF